LEYELFHSLVVAMGWEDLVNVLSHQLLLLLGEKRLRFRNQGKVERTYLHIFREGAKGSVSC